MRWQLISIGYTARTSYSTRCEIPKAAGLLERQRCLQKMVEHAPMVAHVKQIMSARTQFGGLPRQERLAQAVIQMGIAS